MSTGRVWSVAAVCLAVGLGLILTLGEGAGPARFVGQLTGTLLVITPIGLATNITARRLRTHHRAGSPDSVDL